MNYDLALVDWSRAQFALTAIYHWLFVPLTLGLSFLMAFMETLYVKTNNPVWRRITKFWMRIFAVNFAIGVATGIILEFEFGTNWSTYSWMVGDIFGAPLAIEGIMAFFLEATFFVVMFFGWDKVSRRFHLFSTWMVAIGSNLSALWILVANGWMQLPVGTEFNMDTARNEMTNFWDVLFSPMAATKFFHTVTSAYVLASVFVIGISAWYLMKKRELLLAKRSILVAAVFGFLSSLFLAFSGDTSASAIARYQPMKLAAMEGLYQGKENAGLVLFGIPNSQEYAYNNPEDAFAFKIEVPGLLSLLSFRDADAFVPGVNDIVNGNGNQNIYPARKRMEAGRIAINSLADYKAHKKEGDTLGQVEAAEKFKANYKDFGYGYFEDPKQLISNVNLTFYSFHIMVMLGFFFILLFTLVFFAVVRGKIEKWKWLLKIAFWSIPLAYLASVLGWVVAEVGRQPWIIQDLLPTFAATTQISTSTVITTFILFAIIFTALLIADIKIIVNQIKNGPKGE